jgi:hypothetical protein
MSEPQPPADVTLALNAVVHALAHQREEILNTETLFSELIDAVIGVTTGTPVDDPETRGWAARFVGENDGRIQLLGAALHSDDMQLEHRLSHQFTLPPIPPRIEHLAALRAVYDTTVIEGMRHLGLEVTEIEYFKDRLFISTWTGRDGGRVDITSSTACRCGS